MAWSTRTLQLVLSGGPVTLTPIREYNGLRAENRGPFKGQQASVSNPVMFPCGDCLWWRQGNATVVHGNHVTLWDIWDMVNPRRGFEQSTHETALRMHFFHHHYMIPSQEWQLYHGMYRIVCIVSYIILYRWLGMLFQLYWHPVMLSTFCYSYEDQIPIGLWVPILQLYCRNLS